MERPPLRIAPSRVSSSDGIPHHPVLAPSGEHAVAIVVDSAWFPDDFDFSATYSVTRDVELEVRFLPVPGCDEVCIFVARDPKPFETKALIF